MKYIPKYQKPSSPLPTLPLYRNLQQTQDNVKAQYPQEDIIKKEEQIDRGYKIRLAEKEKTLQDHYNRTDLVSGMKKKPTAEQIKYQATQGVSYNDKLRNDPVGTLGPDIAMSLVPELLMLKGPSQAIGKVLNYINPIKRTTPWNLGTADKLKDFVQTSLEPKVSLYRVQPKNFDVLSTIEKIEQKKLRGEELNWIQSNILNNPELYAKYKSRGQFHGAWYEKDPNRLDYYLADKFDESPEILQVKIPRSKVSQYNVTNFPEAQKTSLSYDTEFILPENIRKKATKHDVSEWEDIKKKYKPYALGSTKAIKFSENPIQNPLNKFNSEIDWAKWNPDTPKYPELINEYNAIEESTKKAGTWMKYSDGSKFNGTPEQFIQMKSKNAAAFAGNSELAEKMYRNRLYRGSHQHINDFKNRDRNDYALFTTSSKENAIAYAHEGKGRIFRPEDAQWSGDGLYELAIPQNLPTVIGNGGGNNSWKLLNWDEKIAQGTTKFPNPYEYNQLWSKADAHLKDLELMTKSKDFDPKISNIVPGKKYLSTDVYANYVKNPNNKEAVARIEDVVDTMGDRYLFPTTVHAIDTDRVPVKSLFYNNGMFDISNPNIYKAILPGVSFGSLLKMRKD